MPATLLRRASALLFVAAAAASIGACRQQPEGVVNVVAIDGEPRLADPGRGELTASEAVLVANAAQGLVRFDARGQIEPGLAETWNVSDDGLSYIFRLANGNWPNGRKITADQVAKMLRKLISPSSRDPLADSMGAVDDVVAMTDRVIEIQLKVPRPHLLQLLAQPQLGLVYDGQGTGPFSIDRAKSRAGTLRLEREIPTPDEESSTTERLDLAGADVKHAIEAFASGKADLVLGGRFEDLPSVPRGSLSRRALRFDPAMGLFGLVPAASDGGLNDSDVRQLLSEAIDRDSLLSALDVPGLVPRATVLEPGLDNIPDPIAPAWASTSPASREATLATAAKRLFGGQKRPVIRLALPDGPGADIVFNHLAQDWGALGITVIRAGAGEKADLRLVDEVAPSTAASWYLRHFRCAAAPVCDTDVDKLLEAARNAPVPAQRSALLEQAAQQIDTLQLFIPIAAPIRWSLVSARVAGFAPNRFAIHTLTGLEQQLDRTGE